MFVVKIMCSFLHLKCSKPELNVPKISKLNRKIENDIEAEEIIDQVQFIGLDSDENVYDPYDEKVSLCLERIDIVMENLDLKNVKPANFVSIIKHFYKGLLKNRSFKKAFKKISYMAEKKQFLPPVETFHNFVVKFALHQDFKYKKRISDYFIQSIAALSYELIFKLSQTDLPKYIDGLWLDRWEEILQSIDIKTERYCYWKVETLFNQQKFSKAVDNLDKISHTLRNALFFINYPESQSTTKKPFLSYYKDQLKDKNMLRMLE